MKSFLDYTVGSFKRIFKFDLDPEASEEENVRLIIHQTAFVCSALTWLQPIPLADFILLAPIHAKMTAHIAKAKGFHLTEERSSEIFQELLGSVGMTYLASQVVIGFGKFVPVIFGIYLFPLFYASTWAMGKVVEHYFESRKQGRVPAPSDLRSVYKRALVTGKTLASKIELNDIKTKAAEIRHRMQGTEKDQDRSPPKVKITPKQNTREPVIKIESKATAAKTKPSIDPIEALEKLSQKLHAGDITPNEFAQQRQQLLSDL